MLVSTVAETIRRHRMFERGQRVGVAVSGGADSICLLHVLLELAPEWDLRLRVLHLNHGLRGEDHNRGVIGFEGLPKAGNGSRADRNESGL